MLRGTAAGDWFVLDVGVTDLLISSCRELGDGRAGKSAVFLRSDWGSVDAVVVMGGDCAGAQTAGGVDGPLVTAVPDNAAVSSTERSPIHDSSNCMRTSTSISVISSDIRAARTSCGDNTGGGGGGAGFARLLTELH